MKKSTLLIGLGVIAVGFALSKRTTSSPNSKALAQATSDPLVSGNYSNEDVILGIIAGSKSTSDAIANLNTYGNMDKDTIAVYNSLSTTPTDATNRVATTNNQGEGVILTTTGQWINGQFVTPTSAYDVGYAEAVIDAHPEVTTHKVSQWEYDLTQKLYSSQLQKAQSSTNQDRREYFALIAADTKAQLDAMIVDPSIREG